MANGTIHVSPHWCARPRLWPMLVSSVASLATVGVVSTRVAYPHESEWDALRGDWLRIGADMWTVFNRHGELGKGPR
jgi:hypothetical protein